MSEELRRHPDAPPLFRVQSESLAEIQRAGGLLGHVLVGEGKTLISLLAGTVLGCKRTILLTRAALRTQTNRAVAEWAMHYRLAEGLVVVAYSELSRASGTDLLERLAKGYEPDEICVVADEAHCLAHPTSARTQRFLRFMVAHPGVHFVAMSGTLSNRSITEYAHLSALALGDGSPLPRSRSELEAWAECIDVKGRPAAAHWLYTDELIRWSGCTPARGKERIEQARNALAMRLECTAGVVISHGGDVGASLMIRGDAPHVPDAVVRALHKVADGESPDGEIYPSEAHQAMDARRISLGFYYVWDWTRVGREHPDMEWVEARRRWHQLVRAELDRASAVHYDSPLLVAVACERGEGHPALRQAWARWRSIRGRYRVEDLVITRWISDYVIDRVAELLEKNRRPLIVWYSDRAVGNALGTLGLPVYGQGTEIPDRKTHDCAASIHVHGTGKNLQAWSDQIIIGSPASGKSWEQLLGRTHRTGQKADTVTATVILPTGALLGAFESAHADARFVQATQGQRQRILFADVVDIPERGDLP